MSLCKVWIEHKLSRQMPLVNWQRVQETDSYLSTCSFQLGFVFWSWFSFRFWFRLYNWSQPAIILVCCLWRHALLESDWSKWRPSSLHTHSQAFGIDLGLELWMAEKKLPLSFYSFSCLGCRLLCWKLYVDTYGANIMLGRVILLYRSSLFQHLYTCPWTNLYIGASLTSVEVWRVDFLDFQKCGNTNVRTDAALCI
jgi:hypothetical protein